MYHLNVNSKENDPEFGHVCLSTINSWRVSGLVKGSFYTVKQALFDIFCLFYNQEVEAPFDEQMAKIYSQNPQAFNEEAKSWTQRFAIAI